MSNTTNTTYDTQAEQMLAQAEAEFYRRDYHLALDSYSEVTRLLSLSDEGPFNPVQRRKVHQDAQCGRAATLLCLMRCNEAKEAASEALEESFARIVGDAHDRRRAFLSTLAGAGTIRDYGLAWRLLLPSA